MARSAPRDRQGKHKLQSAGCAADGIASGKLYTVPDEYVERTIEFRVSWPSSRHWTPKLQVFIDFLVKRVFATMDT